MRAVSALTPVSDAALADDVVAGALDVLAAVVPDAELALLEVVEAVEAAEEALAAPVGTLKPVMFPEKGPGAALALAPTPTRLGEGLPDKVGAVPMAACWKASNEPAGALIVLHNPM